MPRRPVRSASKWIPAALSIAILSACSAQNTASMPAATGGTDTDTIAPSYSITPNDNADAPNGSLAAIQTYPGAVIGKTGVFDPASGDYPDGGNGQVVDGLPCRPVMYSNDYHVHVYLGIVDRGKQIALPDAIGMDKPGAPVNGFTNSASCYYYTHTHDASGIVHLEDPKLRPLSDSVYTLRRLLGVWGVKLTATSLGPIAGVRHVFIGTVPLKQTTVSSYREFTGNPNTIKLQSHEVIWIEFGAKYYTAAQLPPVTFYMEY